MPKGETQWENKTTNEALMLNKVNCEKKIPLSFIKSYQKPVKMNKEQCCLNPLKLHQVVPKSSQNEQRAVLFFLSMINNFMYNKNLSWSPTPLLYLPEIEMLPNKLKYWSCVLVEEGMKSQAYSLSPKRKSMSY